MKPMCKKEIESIQLHMPQAKKDTAWESIIQK